MIFPIIVIPSKHYNLFLLKQKEFDFGTKFVNSSTKIAYKLKHYVKYIYHFPPPHQAEKGHLTKTVQHPKKTWSAECKRRYFSVSYLMA